MKRVLLATLAPNRNGFWMLLLATKCHRSIGRDPAITQFDLSSRDGRNFGAVGNKN